MTLLGFCLFALKFAFCYTSELQQFMVMYDKFMEWVNAMLVNITTRSQTKHSVGITESKLEEHKVSTLVMNVFVNPI